MRFAMTIMSVRDPEERTTITKICNVTAILFRICFRNPAGT